MQRFLQSLLLAEDNRYETYYTHFALYIGIRRASHKALIIQDRKWLMVFTLVPRT
jgi:hypothetical protein